MMIRTILLILMTTLASCLKPSMTPQPARVPASLRVMSINVRYGLADDGNNSWPLRRELLFGTIGDFDPDLLGTQEALAFQVEEISAAFPGLEFVGVGRDDGKRAGEFCALFYRADRFDVIDQGHFWLSTTPHIPGSKSWDSSLTRMATWVRLRDRRDGNREILFINTHWDHAGPEARLESAKLIRQRIHQIAPSSPLIITADLNCTEDDEPYRVLLGHANERLRESEAAWEGEGPAQPRLADSYRAAHPQRASDEATFHAFKGTTAGSRIDFILHSPRYRTLSAEVDRRRDDGRFPSDHFAVTTVLRPMSD